MITNGSTNRGPHSGHIWGLPGLPRLLRRARGSASSTMVVGPEAEQCGALGGGSCFVSTLSHALCRPGSDGTACGVAGDIEPRYRRLYYMFRTPFVADVCV